MDEGVQPALGPDPLGQSLGQFPGFGSPGVRPGTSARRRGTRRSPASARTCTPASGPRPGAALGRRSPGQVDWRRGPAASGDGGDRGREVQPSRHDGPLKRARVSRGHTRRGGRRPANCRRAVALAHPPLPPYSPPATLPARRPSCPPLPPRRRPPAPAPPGPAVDAPRARARRGRRRLAARATVGLGLRRAAGTCRRRRPGRVGRQARRRRRAGRPDPAQAACGTTTRASAWPPGRARPRRRGLAEGRPAAAGVRPGVRGRRAAVQHPRPVCRPRPVAGRPGLRRSRTWRGGRRG